MTSRDRGTRESKKLLRGQVRRVLLAISPAEHERRSVAICRSVVSLPEFERSGCVMIFIPIAGEVDTLAIAEAAWSSGKAVLAPRVVWNTHEMLALPCRSFEEGMVIGRYGLNEPQAAPPTPVEQIDFVVAPGLAFDRAGKRLGRGAGFYDRFLSADGFRAVTCAVAFSEQLVDEVPAGPHDWPVQILVTDKEVLRPAKRHQAGKGPGVSE